MSGRTDLVVVGGGISGLAAAWEGVRRGAEVVVLEAGPSPGGKLRTSAIAGVPLDESADAFLARVPEAVELCAELGLEGELVAPSATRAYVWSGGALRPLPDDHLLGVPTDVGALAASGILSPAGVERARSDLSRPADCPPGDESIGALVRRRLGDEVLDRLVAPLLGGIWAGDCDRLSLQVAAANLAAARDRDASLIRGAAAVRRDGLEAAAATGDRPVFLAPRRGMTALVGALVERLGDRVRCGAAAGAIEPEGAGWGITLNGPTAEGGFAGPGGAGGPAAGAAGGSRRSRLTADRVVLATPAFAAARLLAEIAPEPAGFLGGIEHASVVLVAMAVPRAGVEHPLDGTGFLVPPSAGRLLTACSWVTSKWGHLGVDPSIVLLRASAGHAGEERALALPDRELVTALLADLGDTMGLRAEPTEVRVSRWVRSFPQPRPGHLERLRAAEDALARRTPGLAATGAWSRGVGLPACIRGARAAAAQVLDPAATVA